MRARRSFVGFVHRLALLFLSIAGAACRSPEGRAAPPVVESPAAPPLAAQASAEPEPEPQPPPPPRVAPLAVPGDRDAAIVRASDGRTPLTVFVPGLCSNAAAYLRGFADAAQRQGGVVAIEGDVPCGAGPAFHSFSWDASKLHARIERALAAAGADPAATGITLVGYSQGAALGEQLAARWPDRYARIVVIGAPKDPSPKSFARSRGVVTMSCSRDVPARMREASRRIARAGVPSTYVQMPGCTHGNLADGDRVFDEAFAFLRER